MLTLSSLPKTWILDVDGTIVKHNGYKIDGYDTLLDGVRDFFDGLNSKDKVILLTERKNKDIKNSKCFLKKNNIRYDIILTDIPVGERIVVNDNKLSGLQCAYSISKKRDEKFNIKYKIDNKL